MDEIRIQPDRSRPPHRTETRHAQRDGVRLAYQIWGADRPGQPLLAVIGWTAVKEDWRHFGEAIAQDRPVIVFDNRGIGESDVPDGPYTMEQMAADALTVLEAAGHGEAPVHLLGISMGGMIAQTLALHHPDRFARLVLGCTTPGGTAQTPPDRETTALMQPRKNQPAAEVVADMLRAAYTDAWIEGNPERFQELVQFSLAHRRPFRGILAQFAAILEFDVAEQLADLDHETLIIHGTADRMLPYPNAEALAERIANHRLVQLDDIGHVFWDMDQGASAEAVREFLAGQELQ